MEQEKYKTKTVILVDDNQESGETRVALFELEGIFAIHYRRGDKFLGEIKEGIRYDLLIVDRSFPENQGLDGDDIARFSKRVNPSCPVFALSGHPVKNIPYYFDDYFVKGKMDPGVLIEAVKKRLNS